MHLCAPEASSNLSLSLATSIRQVHMSQARWPRLEGLTRLVRVRRRELIDFRTCRSMDQSEALPCLTRYHAPM